MPCPSEIDWSSLFDIVRLLSKLLGPSLHTKNMSICSPSFNLLHLSTFSNDTNSTERCTQSLLVEARFLCCSKTPNFEPTNPLKLVAPFPLSATKSHAFRLKCIGSESVLKTITVTGSEEGQTSKLAEEPVTGGGDGGGCGGGDSFGGGGGGDGGEGGGEEEEEFGPIMSLEEVMKETEARGAGLPSDMLEAAKTMGIRREILFRYLDLQGSIWPLGFLMKHCSMLRNRMLADPSFLFKVGIEVVIDSCCATFAEVQKRGQDFWSEFELYAADLLVGVVVDIALVGMLAPYVRMRKPSTSRGLYGRIQQACGALPSSVFEAERPGCRFSVKQRIATYFYKGVLYGSVGFGCGLIGQGIANMIMTAKRSIKKSEDDIPVPPLVQSAALWGVFLAVSSNTRYQIVNGLERLVEASPLAKQIPPVAMAFTVGVRFANNIYGGMQFVDWAKWSGVQ